jgi:hypothetical protein
MRQPLRSPWSCRRLFGLAAAAVLAAGCDIDAHSRTAEGSFDRTFNVSGPVELDIHSRSGDIDVHVGASGTVRVVGRIRAAESVLALGAGYTPEDQAKALQASPPIRQSGNAISVGDLDAMFLGSGVSISYQVTVPPDTRVRSTSRSGSQTIDAIRGPLSASSRSGSIRVARVERDVDVETRSGDVEVRLPSDGGARVDVETRSGAIDTEGPILADSGRRRRHLSGTLGHGDRRVDVETRSGSIRIRNGGPVYAESPAASGSTVR